MSGKQEKLPRSEPYKPYIMAALKALKPPENMTVSQWADKFRVLSPKDSAAPGRWHTNRTPYLKAPMDAFCNIHVKEITAVMGTQSGKTQMELNMMGYAVDQNPGPMMIVYPTDKLAETVSQNRLKPMLEMSEPLREKFIDRNSQKLELQFRDMYIALVGANSPSSLSSRPVQYVFFDEIDKFPKWSGQEASPMKLAAERTKTFYNKKIVQVSTPTLKNGNIWQAWEKSEAQYKYYVPCPSCGEYQLLKMQNLHWPEGASPTEAGKTAVYRCEFCNEVIDSRQKMDMLRQGEWRAVNDPPKRPQSVAFHLSSFYSPWVTFREIAQEFLSSKDSPETLMNFINSWLAEPWEDKSSKMRAEVVAEKALPYERGTVPLGAQLLTVGVDVQLDHFWYSVRAWGPHMTSWLVDNGRAETWADVATVINRNYPDENGEIHTVNLAGIDSNYNTDEVLQFCAEQGGVAIPTRGSPKPLASRYTVSVIDKAVGAISLRRYTFDPNQMKDYIAGRLSVDAGAAGSWNVYRDIEAEYCNQICAEQKIEKKDKKGRVSYVWEKITSHSQNHYLDTETNNALCAEVLGVRYLMDPEEMPKEEPEKGTQEEWLNVNDNWLN